MPGGATLPEILRTWLRRQRLGPAALARLAGLSRPTVHAALSGRRVSSESVRALAKGLATDPYDGRMDRHAYAEALRDLAEASGYRHLLAEGPAPVDLAGEIARLGLDHAAAVRIAAALRRYAELTPGQRRLFDAALQMLEEGN